MTQKQTKILETLQLVHETTGDDYTIYKNNKMIAIDLSKHS